MSSINLVLNCCARVDRVVSEQISLNGLVMPKGMVINVPVYALHYDPEHWSQPEIFNPERYISMCVRVFMHVCMYVCVHVCIYVCMYVSISC